MSVLEIVRIVVRYDVCHLQKLIATRRIAPIHRSCACILAKPDFNRSELKLFVQERHHKMTTFTMVLSSSPPRRRMLPNRQRQHG